MIGKVWIVARHRRGRKKYYALRWVQPILDAQGQPTYDEAGKVRYRIVTESAKTSDKTTALALAEKKLGELNGLAIANANPADATIEELAALDEQWLRNRGRAEGTAYLSRLALRMFQEVVETPERQPLNLSTITARDVESFLTARTQKISARSLNREMVTLRATFNRAVRVFKVLKENPFANIELVKLEERAIRVLGVEEIGKLLKACGRDQELDLYIRIGLETGCRADEISHIESDNLDLKEGTGRITCSTDWRTKARRNRAIAFSDETIRRIKRWQLRRKGKRYLFAEEGEKPRAHYHHIAKLFSVAVKEAKIAHCTLHDLRRTLGSRMAAEGINQRVAAEVLGHSDVRTTAKYYQRVDRETIRAVILKLMPTGTDGRKR